MPRPEKLVVTNNTALLAKYGGGFGKIQAAIGRLVKADQGRGVATSVVALDDEDAMRRRGAPVVTKAASARQNKDAIDALCAKFHPEYLMILGSVDVVPHQDLSNPAYAPPDDTDARAWGDLPYACEQGYSRSPARFLAPTRVVGRLPDLTGQGDPAYLLGLLDRACSWKTRPRAGYEQYFGLTADAWRGSTSLSLTNLFGSAAQLKGSPPQGPRWSPTLLARRAHFINCHGAPIDPQYYGQPAGKPKYPVAHDAAWIARKGVSEGTVVAAECCYGAELYDPKETGGQSGIANTYLAEGAYGVFGSTTIAYGPPDGNGSADLICQYFLGRVLRGASLGRAALEARQQFVQAAAVLDAYDLKTLAQFHLLGDPSIHPVARAAHGLAKSRTYSRVMARPEAQAASRLKRREWLVRNGTLLGTVTGATGPARTGVRGKAVLTPLRAIARELAMRKVQFRSYDVLDPARRILAPLRGEARDSVHVAIGSRPAARPANGGRAVRDVTVVVASVRRGRLVGLRQLHAR